MEDKQDLFDKFIEVADSYSPDPDLAEKAIEKINQREATVTFKKPIPKWVWYAMCGFLVAVIVAVFLSVYLTRPNIRITVYSAESIESEDIENLNSFISENNLDIKYFKDKQANSSIAKIKETGAFAYITQSFYDIGETGFDILELKVVLLQNAEFEFYSTFNSLNNSIVIQNIKVNYSIYETLNNKSYLSKFDYEDKSYFLEIRSKDSATAVLEKYITQLLK